ncbi:hypothetical protein [Mycoplasmoides pirum]|uniref:hypothetical protein n=1 Tax=Mycoplasmoides pirum TaxID=2122 RepID=UPI00069921A3|nr:hypothetical protein [Mycoplasmoides pirum]
MSNKNYTNPLVQNVIDQLLLLSIYQPLLKSKQIKYFKLYYENNLTYAEIAKKFNVSRAAIGESISQTKSLLKNYEKKLKLWENHKKRLTLYKSIKNPKLQKQLIEFENNLCWNLH